MAMGFITLLAEQILDSNIGRTIKDMLGILH